MATLRIYDSQGMPVGDTAQSESQKVQDFFFAGVRLALDGAGPKVELSVFFRARESQASRAEQYYAVYEARPNRDLFSGFRDLLERRVTGDLGMEVVTSTEDTNVFESIMTETAPRAPGRERDLEDIKQLVNHGPKAVYVGVRSGREAVGLLNDISGRSSARKLAISENGNSPHLDDYDVVIETGQSSGLTFLYDTEQSIEQLRKRRRQRFRSTGLDNEPTGVKQFLPGILQDHYLGFLSATALLSVGLLIGVILGGSCFLFGGSLPVVDNPVCAGDNSGDGGTHFKADILNQSNTSMKIVPENATESRLRYSVNGLDDDVNRTVSLHNQSGNDSHEMNVTANKSSASLKVEDGTLGTTHTYNLTLEANGSNAFTVFKLTETNTSDEPSQTTIQNKSSVSPTEAATEPRTTTTVQEPTTSTTVAENTTETNSTRTRTSTVTATVTPSVTETKTVTPSTTEDPTTASRTEQTTKEDN